METHVKLTLRKLIDPQDGRQPGLLSVCIGDEEIGTIAPHLRGRYVVATGPRGSVGHVFDSDIEAAMAIDRAYAKQLARKASA